MSFFKTENSDDKHYIFGKNGAEKLCQEFNLKLLAKIPIYSQGDSNISQKKKQYLEEHYINLGKVFTDLLN